MATVRNKKGRFSKTGIVLREIKIGELKNSVVKSQTRLKKAKMNQTINVSDEKLFEGSRIMDLLFMIKQLKDRCTVCGELQNIAHQESETIIGLASIFYLECICGNINAIYSANIIPNVEKKNRKCKIFDVNTRCVGGGKYH